MRPAKPPVLRPVGKSGARDGGGDSDGDRSVTDMSLARARGGDPNRHVVVGDRYCHGVGAADPHGDDGCAGEHRVATDGYADAE